jgi:RNA polymerase sigma factor (sigma-70 family)
LIAELRRLPNRQRAAVALRYWADLPDREIATQLGCSETSVRGYIFRALGALRVALDAERTNEVEAR